MTRSISLPSQCRPRRVCIGPKQQVPGTSFLSRAWLPSTLLRPRLLPGVGASPSQKAPQCDVRSQLDTSWEVLSQNLDASPICYRDRHVHVPKERVVSVPRPCFAEHQGQGALRGCPLLQPPCPGARRSVAPIGVQRSMTAVAQRLSHEVGVATVPRATRGTSVVAVCTPLLLVRGREWRRRSNRSESEGASDERPSGLTVKTPSRK